MSRIKRQYSSASPQVYERFKSKNPSPLELPKSLWREIVYSINWAYRDYILETGEKVRMPYGFGDLSINKKLRRKTVTLPDGREKITLPVDWPKTLKAGKYIYNFNDHSDGYFFGWVYFKETGRLKYNRMWYFKASRDSGRLLAKYIKKPGADYKDRYQQYYK